MHVVIPVTSKLLGDLVLYWVTTTKLLKENATLYNIDCLLYSLKNMHKALHSSKDQLLRIWFSIFPLFNNFEQLHLFQDQLKLSEAFTLPTSLCFAWKV